MDNRFYKPAELPTGPLNPAHCMRITLLAVAAALWASGGNASSQTAPPAVPAAAPAASAPGTATARAALADVLQPSTRLNPPPRAEQARQLPIVLRARSLRSQPDIETVAEGDVEFRRGGLIIQADRLAYDTVRDLASAKGDVRVTLDGATYAGPELQLSVQRFEGFFLQPLFEFPALGAGGRADRIDFLGNARSRALNASYTSCPREPGIEPAWELRTESVTIDLDTNEGVAEGAVLRFQGRSIVALPTLSFPLGDTRKSGWLPPSLNLDNRSGISLSVPYYWNIAPNRDATLAPRLITRRGAGLDSEFRYLESSLEGVVRLDWLPHDRLAGRSRQSWQWQHEGSGDLGLRYTLDASRVSDADWWKDFPDAARSFTPRLLPARAGVELPLRLPFGDGRAYGRVLRWQVLQDSDSLINAPYQRSPQVGLQWRARADNGLELGLEGEFNRFSLPDSAAAAASTTPRPTGDRWHLLGAISRPWREEGWWLVPKLSFNAVAYDQTVNAPGGLVRATRTVPSFSLDAGFELERSTRAFGRDLHQTLEPRILYVNTPYREQASLPNYDSAAKDFNFVSLYSDNAFSGVDRVSDSHQITAGFTTRLVDARSGAEALRLGLVQRYLLRTQRVAAQPDGTPDGAPLERRLSDALLVGSTSVLPGWTLDGAVQYSPDINRSVRSILGARYSPGPFRTVSTTYRLARGLSEQLEVGWQWPLYGAGPSGVRSAGGSGGSCSGAWYSVGRFNYSLKDRRLTDSVLGLEYDAGCWIGRVVAEQLSTGRSQATTRLLLQLELVGLSRIGSNPLKVLKDNIPGYRLLREDRGSRASPVVDGPIGSPVSP
jgi:LPS-assembly protein